MQAAGRLIYESLVEAYYGFSQLMVYNVLWLVFTALVLTAPPAAAGLYYATNRLARNEVVSWRTFFEGFRLHFWLSWRWALVNLLALVVLISNLSFYGSLEAEWGGLVQGGVLGLAILYALLQVYTWPLLVEQSDRRVRTALRNSVVLFIRRPGFSLGLCLFLVLLLAVSTFLLPPAWLVITAGLAAYLSNCGAIFVIDDIHGRPRGETQT